MCSHNDMNIRSCLILGCAAGAVMICSLAQTTKFGVSVKAGPMDAILLKDYAPESSLVVPEAKIAKARFPVIDVHAHSSQSRARTPQDVDDWVRTMDEV